MIPSLLEIANELDSLGLHKEADALDRILQKKADVLAYEEKPFLARLAKIMLILKNYKSGEIIKDDLTFPLTGVRLMGLTRQTAIEELQKHLKAFIEQYLIPNLDKSYKGSRYETEYRQFISEVYSLSQMLQGIFTTRSEQQSVREGIDTIEQVKRMVGHIIVFARSQEELGKGLNKEADRGLHEAQQILGSLTMAIRQLNEKEVHELIKELLEIFPRKIDDKSPIYQLVVEALKDKEGRITLVRQNIIEDEARNRLDYAEEADLNQAESYNKRYNAELARKRDLEQHVSELEERALALQKEASKYEFPPVMIPNYKEFKEKTTREPDTYLLPEKKVAHYKNKVRRYEVIAGDLSTLEKWLSRYLKRPDINQVISFSLFLSKMVNVNMAKEAFTIINANIADLREEVKFDIDALEKSSKEVSRQLINLTKKWNDTKDQVIWDMWHEKYIIRMVQVLNYILAPETRGEETSSQAFNRALTGFNKLLNYEI